MANPISNLETDSIMGAPIGNTNASKKNRLLREGLKRELVQDPEAVLAINRQLIAAAKAGEQWAQTLIRAETDGKPAQAIVGGDDDDNPIKLEGVLKLVRPSE
jgi:hypothetical protein